MGGEKMVEIDECQDFPPAISSHCDWCGYYDICPKMMLPVTTKEAFNVIDAESAQKAAELLVLMARVKKELTAQMKTWIGKNTSVRVGDKVLDFHSKESVKFPDPDALAVKLLELGVPREDVWGAFSATETSVKKALKGSGLIKVWPDVKALANISPTTRFDFKKMVRK